MFRLLLVFAVLTATLPTVAIAQGRIDTQREPKQAGLWAGISVPKALFRASEARGVDMSFAVVNDASSTVNPEIGASHLSINGVEPNDWAFVINNGLRSSEFEALPPGHVLSFGYLLTYFSKPGIYTVRWWGQNFRAQPITFRVLPDKP